MVWITKSKRPLYILLCIMTCAISAGEDNSESLKRCITLHQQSIHTAFGQEKALLMQQLAVLYLKDQEQEKAFSIFLEALQNSVLEPVATVGEMDKRFYDQALPIYFDQTLTPKEAAQKICDEFEDGLKRQPDLHRLAYILALAHANLGKFEVFFDLFFRAYRFYPEHFLAYKTKAVLHIKLYERARTELERNSHREAIHNYLMIALEKEPLDYSLYKPLVTFVSPEKKQETTRHCLKKILNTNIITPRGDIEFLVEKAVDSREFELAQCFLEHARKWYPQSRIIDNAQAYLDAQIKADKHHRR